MAFEGAERHVRDCGQLLICNRPLVMIADVSQDGTEIVGGCCCRSGFIQGSGDPRCTRDSSVGVEHGDFIRDMPSGGSAGVGYQLEAIYYSIAGQDVIIVEAELIGQESW